MTRDYVLSEIQRTAADNDGKPLGKVRFFAATGIKEADWSGRYWTRWSDALLEAGFAPNVLNTSLPEETLLSKLATLVVELGHFPLSAEIRMKARNDVTFPSHNTFRRFGGKAALAARLRDYGQKHQLRECPAPS